MTQQAVDGRLVATIRTGLAALQPPGVPARAYVG
jgi:hypothetical protein